MTAEQPNESSRRREDHPDVLDPERFDRGVPRLRPADHMSLIVYVAGPYRAAARFQGGSRRYAIDANVMNAGWFGALVAQAGGVPLVPHAIGYLVDDAADALPDAYWLAATLEMLRRCDALLLLPGWQDSAGSRAERDEAVRRGMPILDLDGESRQFAVVVAEWVRRIQETP